MKQFKILFTYPLVELVILVLFLLELLYIIWTKNVLSMYFMSFITYNQQKYYSSSHVVVDDVVAYSRDVFSIYFLCCSENAFCSFVDDRMVTQHSVYDRI